MTEGGEEDKSELEAEASTASKASDRDEEDDSASEPEATSEDSKAKSAGSSGRKSSVASLSNSSEGSAVDGDGSNSDSDSNSGSAEPSSARPSLSLRPGSPNDPPSAAESNAPSPTRPPSPRPQRPLARPTGGTLPMATQAKSQTVTQQRAKPQMVHLLPGQWRPPPPRPEKLPALVEESPRGPPPLKPLVPRRKRKTAIWNYHPEVEVARTTATTIQLLWKPPYKPTVGRLSFRVQLSRDGWHFATAAVTAQLHHTLEGLQPNTRYAATVLATIEDAGTVLWDGRGFTHKIVRTWTRPALGFVPADRFQGKPFYTPDPSSLAHARPRPASAPVLPSVPASPPTHPTPQLEDPFQRQTWVLCRKSLISRPRKVVQSRWKMPSLQSFVLDGEADAGAESLCAILQHAYDKADVPILEFVTEDEFCTLVTEVFQVLGVDRPTDAQLHDAFADADPDASGQVRTRRLFHFLLCHAPYPDRPFRPRNASAPDSLAAQTLSPAEGSRRDSAVSSGPSSAASASAGAIFSPHSPRGNEARLNSFLRRRKVAREGRRSRRRSSPGLG